MYFNILILKKFILERYDLYKIIVYVIDEVDVGVLIYWRGRIRKILY